MLCCGLISDQIGEMQHISKSTVYNYLNSLYKVFHAGSCEEMIVLAWEMELITTKDFQLYNRKRTLAAS